MICIGIPAIRISIWACGCPSGSAPGRRRGGAPAVGRPATVSLPAHPVLAHVQRQRGNPAGAPGWGRRPVSQRPPPPGRHGDGAPHAAGGECRYACGAGGAGPGGLVEGTDYRGVPVVSVLQSVPGTGWFMVTKVDAAEVYGPLRQRVWVGTLGLLGVLSLMAGALGFLLKRHDAEMVQEQLNLFQHYEWLMREANDIIFLIDGDGRILEANTRAVESYGYTLVELQAMNILHLRRPDNPAEATVQIRPGEGIRIRPLRDRPPPQGRQHLPGRGQLPGAFARGRWCGSSASSGTSPSAAPRSGKSCG